jgi:hypothetical protein
VTDVSGDEAVRAACERDLDEGDVAGVGHRALVREDVAHLFAEGQQGVDLPLGPGPIELLELLSREHLAPLGDDARVVEHQTITGDDRGQRERGRAVGVEQRGHDHVRVDDEPQAAFHCCSTMRRTKAS